MQNISVELLTQDKKQIWDDFVDDSNNGTIFHKQKFLSYHKEIFKDNEHHLLFYEGKKLIAVFPLAIFDSEEGKVIDARLTVASLSDDTLCALQKGGEYSLTVEEIDKMVEIALEKSKELRKLIK